MAGPSSPQAKSGPGHPLPASSQRRSRFHHRLDGRVERPAMTMKKIRAIMMMKKSQP
jgi:hypothetical protein